jgi:type II secretory pathway component PulJ
MRRRALRGFTLLEVVLAVTLALALMAAMLTFYKQAADVRAIVKEAAETVGSERTVMDLMTADVRAALVCSQAGFGVEGNIDGMRLATTALPGATVWAVQRTTEGPAAPAERDVQIIGYRLRITEDEQGQPVIEGLERTYQKVLTARTAEEGKEILGTLLAPRLKFLRLRYWDAGAGAWNEGWGGGDLPAAVEIVLGIEPLPEGVEPLQYPYETFRRVVYVPAGAKAPGGSAIVRGLGGESAP